MLPAPPLCSPSISAPFFCGPFSSTPDSGTRRACGVGFRGRPVRLLRPDRVRTSVPTRTPAGPVATSASVAAVSLAALLTAPATLSVRWSGCKSITLSVFRSLRLQDRLERHRHRGRFDLRWLRRHLFLLGHSEHRCQQYLRKTHLTPRATHTGSLPAWLRLEQFGFDVGARGSCSSKAGSAWTTPVAKDDGRFRR